MQRIRVQTTGWSGGPGISTFYINDAVAENAATAQAAVDGLDPIWDEIVGLFPASWTATVITAVDTLSTGTGAITATDTITPWTKTGGSSAGFGPLASGGCVTWLTNTFLNGRRLKGRTFVSPVASEFADTDGTPKSNMLTGLNGFGAGWAGWSDGTSSPVVWHRPVAGAGGASDTIVSYTVRDQFAVLRSRRD